MSQNKLKTMFVTIFTLGAIIIMAGSTTENNNFNFVKSDAVFSKKAAQQYSLQKPVLKASLTKNSLKLSWSEIKEADEYRIYRSKKINGKYKKSEQLPQAHLIFQIQILKAKEKHIIIKLKLFHIREKIKIKYTLT